GPEAMSLRPGRAMLGMRRRRMIGSGPRRPGGIAMALRPASSSVLVALLLALVLAAPPAGARVFEQLSASLTDYPAQLSDDGRFLLLVSSSSDLDPVCHDAFPQVFVRDLVGGTATCVSVSSVGVAANEGSYYASMSADASVVAFRSYGTNLDAAC